MAESDNVDMLDLEFMDVDVDELIQKNYKNCVYMDIQGFRTSRHQFMCKAICLVDGDSIFHRLVKSPYSFNRMSKYYQRQANWLINRYHGLKYDCGDFHIIEVKDLIFPKIRDKIVLVKGAEKVSWLKHIFRDRGEIECVNVEDLDDFDLSLRKTEPYDVCEYHRKISGWTEGPCAMSTALMLRDLTLNNYN